MERRAKTMCPWIGKLATPKKGKKGKDEGSSYHREIPRAQPTTKDGADGKQYPWGYRLSPNAGRPLKAEDTAQSLF